MNTNFDKSTVGAASVISLGLVLGALSLARGVTTWKKLDHTIDVKGLAERTVTSDQASLNVNFVVTGNNLTVIYPAVKASQDKIKKFLVDFGIKADEIQNGIPSLTDRQAGYSEQKHGERYILKGGAQVTTSNVQAIIKASEQLQELLKAGVAIEGVSRSFNFTGLNAIKPEMIKEATRNARAAAESFASDSGVKLGDLKSATQGAFQFESPEGSWSERDSVIKKIRVVTQVYYGID